MKRLFLLCAFLSSAASLSAAEPAREILVADFEGDTYGDWKVTGEAFGPGPARGTLPGQMHVDGFKGKGLVNSFFNGDASTGTLTSPAFKIDRKHINFLIGGGRDAEKTCMNLLVGGKVVRNATGPNEKAGGSETLLPESWDVSDLAGQMAVIQIIDNATGGWGHINVDHIVQSDRRAAQWVTNPKIDLTISQRYLLIPIKNGAAKRKLTTLVNGVVEVVNDVELANDEPDWWAHVDVGAWKGRQITLRADKLAEDSKALTQIKQSNELPGADKIHKEPLRGQFHFSSRRGWLNDPNGLVYFNGEYHLFYQHNPYGREWGNMHWGHAVSPDMVRWEELGDKLAPDSFGPMFSGSAVVDWDNTSGLGKAGKPPLVLIYTAAGDPTVQCIASSIDGRTFTKYAGNPVVKQIAGGNRDPKVFWHEPTKKWVMVLYVELNGKHTIHFFNSPNLREWKLASVTENTTGKNNYLFECPDFFELPVDGDAGQKKWVLMAANSEYATGTFDGVKFTPEQSKLPGQRGQGFYAAQTFSDIPSRDGRRIQIGWFQTPAPGMPFNQSMTVPLELKLLKTADGPRLSWSPIVELEALRVRSTRSASPLGDPDGVLARATKDVDLLELRAEFQPGEKSETIFRFRGATIAFDSGARELIVNNHRAPVVQKEGKIRLTAYFDRNGLEVFANDGLTYFPIPFTPKADALGLVVQTKGGPVKFSKLEVHELKSSWR